METQTYPKISFSKSKSDACLKPAVDLTLGTAARNGCGGGTGYRRGRPREGAGCILDSMVKPQENYGVNEQRQINGNKIGGKLISAV